MSYAVVSSICRWIYASLGSSVPMCTEATTGVWLCQFFLCYLFAQAPTFKWGIGIANIADFKRPAEQVSYPQQLAVTTTGLIWMPLRHRH